MSLMDELVGVLRLPDARPTQAIKAEIREELEFHVAMLSEENERRGMSPQEARRDALRKFGDMETIEASCRKVQLGERTWLQRVQVGSMVALVAAVAWLGISSYQNQARQEESMQRMQLSLEQMQSNLLLIADRAPPVVVETFPAKGAIDVDPSAKEIRVTFSKPMMDGSWSWCQTALPFPESSGPIGYRDDQRTCVMPVRLEPDTEYALKINSEQFGNFKDPYGRSAEPYFLCFTTAAKN